MKWDWSMKIERTPGEQPVYWKRTHAWDKEQLQGHEWMNNTQTSFTGVLVHNEYAVDYTENDNQSTSSKH